MVQPRVCRIRAGAEASRDVLDIILLFRRPEIAFACCGPHTLLTHSELIVGENHCTPSGARPLGFGAAVPDSTFAWSCFLLLDLAACYGLGLAWIPTPSQDLGLCKCQLPGFRSFRQQQYPTPQTPRPPRCLHPSRSAALSPPGGMAPGGQTPCAETQALRVSFRSSQQVARCLRAGLESGLSVDLLGGLGYALTSLPGKLV